MSTSLARGYSASVATGRDGEARLALARSLSLLLAGLMVIASAAGLWKTDLYQDPRAVAEMYRGYDLISLLLVVPAMIVAAVAASRSVRAQLVWLGTLMFAVYDYALYVFGARFNDAFLVHVAIFALSMLTLGLVLVHLDAVGIARSFSTRTPVRGVAAALVLLAVGLGGMWIVGAVRFALTEELPREGSKLVLPVAMTHLGWVLDLAVLVPAYAATAVVLWRRGAWGYVLAPSLLVAGTLQQVSYMTALSFQASAHVPGAAAFDPVEPFIVAVYAVACMALVLSVRPRSARA